MNNDISVKAVESVLRADKAFCKFLSANDSGETGGHQSGFLISKSASTMLFAIEQMADNHILKRNVKVKWNDDFFTDSTFTWYESKNELRITKFGRSFPLIGPEFTGALFVLNRMSDEEYEAFVLNTDDDIQQFLDAFGLTPAETNRPVDLSRIDREFRERAAINNFINELQLEFPSSEEMSAAARDIYQLSFPLNNNVVSNPDRVLLDWTEFEYRLFRALEQARYGTVVGEGFKTVDDFVIFANQVLNRRKSRAGKSLEHHLAAIFDKNNIQYSAQQVTEGNKKPDFVFPSIDDYHDLTFSVDKLCTLAAKTTCKDRWRQIINEADRLRDRNKYLCTMQQGISAAQMDEMQAERVILVVPEKYIVTYPADRRNRIWTIRKFVSYVREMEGL